MEIFDGGGAVRLMKDAAPRIGGAEFAPGNGNSGLINLARPLLRGEDDEDDFPFADEEDEDIMDALHLSPLFKR